ncbi:hypothetical protein VTN77DRAFT_5956 [Rasamsonia byssochlamydoides]|uniref:uncharacterized protein n=1 Tax=Rasamsonia byssochlamydoides TaxID=89139 RepID=UPI003742E885
MIDISQSRACDRRLFHRRHQSSGTQLSTTFSSSHFAEGFTSTSASGIQLSIFTSSICRGLHFLPHHRLSSSNITAGDISTSLYRDSAVYNIILISKHRGQRYFYIDMILSWLHQFSHLTSRAAFYRDLAVYNIILIFRHCDRRYLQAMGQDHRTSHTMGHACSRRFLVFSSNAWIILFCF